MAKRNEFNERTKRAYFAYLKEAQGYSEHSVDAVALAIGRFETSTKHRDFNAFHREQAIAFKRHLSEQASQRGPDKLSKSTIVSTLTALRKFFFWLAGQPGFKSTLRFSDSDYFNPSDRDLQIAKSTRPRVTPPLESIMTTLQAMPADTVFGRRDRALMAFILLTGCRDLAAVSVKLKHVSLDEGFVYLDAREVRTKNAKTIKTYFYPVGDGPLTYLTDWIAELQSDHGWRPEDPLFPKTRVAQREMHLFGEAGITPEHWSNADPVRRIFKTAFARAKLPYYQPHSFRNTLVRLGLERCQSPEHFKAWSQNMGHERVMTTFNSYGHVDDHRQAEIIKGLGTQHPSEDRVDDLIDRLSRAVKKRG